MTRQQEAQIKKLGVFHLYQAKALGLSHQRISELVQEGQILRVGHGLYLHPEVKIDSEIEFEIACAKFGGEAVIGGLTALYYYGLIEQVPQQTWVLLPAHKVSHSKRYKTIRSKVSLETEVVIKKGYKIVSIERALIEGLKYVSKIGERTALGAVRKAIQKKLTNLNKIGKATEKLEMDSVLDKYFEILLA